MLLIITAPKKVPPGVLKLAFDISRLIKYLSLVHAGVRTSHLSLGLIVSDSSGHLLGLHLLPLPFVFTETYELLLGDLNHLVLILK